MFQNFMYASRQVFRLRWINAIKLLSLSLGFMLSALFFARVAFDQSYNSFLPDAERIYTIENKITYADKTSVSPMVFAAIAPTVRSTIAGVESATRFGLWGALDYARGDKFFTLETALVDEYLFDVLDFGIESGETSALRVPYNAFISRRAADMIFGAGVDAVGQKLEQNGRAAIVCGVFSTIPKNSNLDFDIAVAFGDFPTHWDGGDSYRTYIKLDKGVRAEQVEAGFPSMVAANMDVKGMEERGLKVGYLLTPVREVATRDFADIDLVMSILAFVLLAVGALNYVLLTLSSLASRAKEVGVHKASGASSAGVFSLVLFETLIYVVVAAALTALLLWVMQSPVENLAGRYADLFASGNLWAVGLVVLLLLLVAGVIPAWIFARVNVTQIFRRYTDAKASWKRALLVLQFIFASFVVSFLIIIILQHSAMVNSDLGYRHDNVAYTKIELSGREEYILARDLVERLPCVRVASLANTVPLKGTASGFGISNEESREKVMICGGVETDERFFDLFGIDMLAGRNLESADDSTLCIVDQTTVDELRAKGIDALGYTFLSEGQMWTVGGVASVAKFSSQHSESYPVVYTGIRYWDMNEFNLIVRFDTLTAANMKAVDTELRRAFPRHDFQFKEYADQLRWQYASEQMFRDGVGMASIVLLVIAAMGVVGYVSIETRRRAREVAIRRVNGASARSVVWLFMRDAGLSAIVGSIVGVTAAYIVGTYWQESFALKAAIGWWVLAAGIVVVVALVALCVWVETYRAARANPANFIKSE